MESIRKEKGGLKPCSPVKFVPANIFGIANSGVSNAVKHKLEKTKSSVFSPARRSMSNFNKKQYDEPVNLIDEMLSTVSSGRFFLYHIHS